MSSRYIRSIFFAFSVALLAFKGEPEKSSVKAAVDAFVSDPALKHAGTGFCMKEVTNGDIVYSYNAEQSLVPASVMKLVTTYAALKKFGDVYRFATMLGYIGKVDSTGLLRGDLVIKGGGDPTLGSGRFPGTAPDDVINTWLKKISAAGIKKWSGAMRLDNFRYDRKELPRDWLLEDVANYYGAIPFAINYRENQFKIILKPGKKVGDPVAIIKTDPAFNFVANCYVTTAASGSGDNAYIIPTANGYVLQGTIPLGTETFTIKGAYQNPDFMLADELVSKISREGGGSFSGKADTTVLHIIVSPSLAEIVAQTNLNSINLYAEAILREIGLVSSGKPGNTQNGVKGVMDLLKKEGLNTNGLIMRDGCGLARANAINADFLTQLLVHGYGLESFYNSLPVAGQTGAMKNMGKGTFIDGNMRAKTGHMEGVRSYAGYVKAKDGKTYAFALLVNNYTCSSAEIKQKIEKLLISIAN
jgi:serine-type D-Ala-D-Ala carboxypeptidase/endopeptidase (penicillin-binding protein 4)